MGHRSYPGRPWPVIDPIDPDSTTPVGFDWSEWLRSSGATAIESATWTVSSGLVNAGEFLTNADTETVVILTAAAAPENSMQQATCRVTAGVATEERTMRVPVRQL